MKGVLKRELGIVGATMMGLGSIIGTGVFVSIGIAAGITGPAVTAAILLAACLATCNALSSAQLAAAFPVSGGTYEYGYRLLHPLFGFTAGWTFLCAKTASAATAALGAAGYALRLLNLEAGPMLPSIAAGIIIAFTMVALRGIRSSNILNICIVSVTLFSLIGFITTGTIDLSSDALDRFSPYMPASGIEGMADLFHATALMFVAYTGYGRIATLGEEVKRPRFTIPRAIIVTLVVSAILYILVAAVAIAAVGSDTLFESATSDATPLVTAATAFNSPLTVLILSIGAVTAMLGVLLNLILGLSRVALAMGRRRDLPPVIGKLTSRQSPNPAVLLVGLFIAIVALAGNVKATWTFSAFTVLIYYAITNFAALRLPLDQRLYPRFIPWAGLAGCLLLTLFLPLETWLLGMGLIISGIMWRYIVQKVWRVNS